MARYYVKSASATTVVATIASLVLGCGVGSSVFKLRHFGVQVC